MRIPSRFTWMMGAVICATMGLPIAAAVVLSQHQALEREQALVTGLSRQALISSEKTADQLAAGSRVINAIPAAGACSEQALDVMRRVDLGSTLLQAVARRQGNAIICSSLGNRRRLTLGEPDFVSKTGAPTWTNVKLWDGDERYLLIASGSFVGIIHNDLPLSFVDSFPQAIVGTFNWSRRIPLVQRGRIDAKWIGKDVAGEGGFRSGDYAVAVLRSNKYDIASVAAVPLSSTNRFGIEAALLLMPIGILAGLLLSVFMLYTARARASMPGMIRHALKSGDFHLLYQPIFDLRTGEMTGAEALIRWRRSNGETIPPETFIAVAEQTGMIRLITARVLDLLAGDAARVLRFDPNFRFGVNFSAADLHSPSIVEEVERFVTRAGLRFRNLTVEATERSFVDVELAKHAITRLRSLGVKVAIDDFGTGYSSLGYLAELQVDYLKIDRLFVHALGTGSATSHVAARIIEMAKDLRIELVAEGIETAEQAIRLKSANVEFAQGYQYAAPMRLDALLERLRTERELRAAAIEAEPLPRLLAAI